MRYLVTSEEMRQLDGYSIRTMGIPSVVLMERAALCVTEEIQKRRPAGQRVLILSGTGNNGADGLAMARMLTLDGYSVRVVVTGNKAHATSEWLTQYDICKKMKIPLTVEIPDLTQLQGERYDIIVDAMLGTGLSRAVSGKISDCIDAVNASRSYVVSVDTPSGISDTGCVLGNAVQADLTVTFEYQKLGLTLFPGVCHAGECVVRSIGILPQGLDEMTPSSFTLSAEDLDNLPKRPQDSNKGTFGRVLVAAGSRNMAGAAVLAGEAAYRSGAGLVRIFTPECNRTIIQTALPEAILTTYGEREFSVEQMDELCSWAKAIVIGPGLGISQQTTRFVRYILQYGKVPTVLDADALNILAENPDMTGLLREDCILTPHLGEMARLTGRSVADIRSDTRASALQYAGEHGVTLVQKDARTIVAFPDGKTCYVNTCGNSGMATGGSGDVLSGILGGLLAGGLSARESAVYGVLMHGLAGDAAAERKGQRALLAGDIVKAL